MPLRTPSNAVEMQEEHQMGLEKLVFGDEK